MMKEVEDHARRQAAREFKEAKAKTEIEAQVLAQVLDKAQQQVQAQSVEGLTQSALQVGHLEAKCDRIADQAEYERQRAVKAEAEHKRMADEAEAERQRAVKAEAERKRMADEAEAERQRANAKRSRLKAELLALREDHDRRSVMMSKLQNQVMELRGKQRLALQQLAAVEEKNEKDRKELQENNDLITKEYVVLRKKLADASEYVANTERERDEIFLKFQTFDFLPKFEQRLRWIRCHVTGAIHTDVQRESLEDVMRVLVEKLKDLLPKKMDYFVERHAGQVANNLKRWRMKRNEIVHGFVELDADGHQDFQTLTSVLAKDVEAIKERFDIREEAKRRDRYDQSYHY
jgi:hypothetical protein